MPPLTELIASSEFEVVAVVSQPDRPAGRGNKLHAPPTKMVAQDHNIPVFQPSSLSKDKECVDALRQLEPDYAVMVAFGQILKKSMLELPKHGIVNIHASLLPKYRGAAPINWAVINGDTETGITTMFTEAGVDTGPMLMKAVVPIPLEMTADELAKQLSQVGAKLVVLTLRGLRDGTVRPEPQDSSLATVAPMMSKELGKIDWKQSALQIHNLVRGLVPWPGAYTRFRDGNLKILSTRPSSAGSVTLPGQIRIEKESSESGSHTAKHGASCILVACGADGSDRLELLSVQPPGKNSTLAHDWANGARLAADEGFE